MCSVLVFHTRVGRIYVWCKASLDDKVARGDEEEDDDTDDGDVESGSTLKRILF